jgi:hypothetical protein
LRLLFTGADTVHTRRFVEEGDFLYMLLEGKQLKQQSYKSSHFVLFSDCLVLCKVCRCFITFTLTPFPSLQVSAAVLKVRAVYWLRGAQLGHPLGVDPVLGAEVLIHTVEDKAIRIKFDNAAIKTTY